MEDRRKIGLILVIITGLLCACPGLSIAAFGGLMGLMGLDPATRLEIYETSDPTAAIIACFLGLCLGGAMLSIPVLIGLITLRPDPAARLSPDEPIPPAI